MDEKQEEITREVAKGYLLATQEDEKRINGISSGDLTEEDKAFVIMHSLAKNRIAKLLRDGKI